MKYSKMGTLKSLMLAALVTLGLTSCSNDDSSSNGTASLTVRMTDAPGDYDAVLIDVQDVMIKTSSTTQVEGEEDGWVSVGNVQTGIYDLLELTGGVSQVLANTEVEAGFVSQIRLILGNDNSVVVDGETIPLSTPSAQQSGLKLQLNQELEAGENYSFLLDFDVDESIVRQENGGYTLKPVIRLSAEANAGAIIGEVQPSTFRSLVKATNATTTVSAYTATNGKFSLNGVPPGTYQITITPDAVAQLPSITINNVVVEANSTTEIETQFLE